MITTGLFSLHPSHFRSPSFIELLQSSGRGHVKFIKSVKSSTRVVWISRISAQFKCLFSCLYTPVSRTQKKNLEWHLNEFSCLDNTMASRAKLSIHEMSTYYRFSRTAMNTFTLFRFSEKIQPMRECEKLKTSIYLGENGGCFVSIPPNLAIFLSEKLVSDSRERPSR
jgi:hypothetical protein